ncbi:MAG: Crp/Fnr family transcriptional regulator [Ignavibacteria bacterium]|nr:Crp/Fnr family transcriptional regulator [Ignavibacteria bacterium]
MATNTGLEEIIKNYGELTQFIFHKNDVLFKENDQPAGLYCIESGSVKIFKDEPADQERILHLATAGEILGLHSVVNNHIYTNSATAISETRASFITAQDFMNLINSNNTYKLLVMKSLCSRIDSMEDHIVRISEKMSDERFADTLLVLIDKYGINKTKDLNIHLSIDELASYTCTSKSYMKKIITEFTHRGLITFSSGNIKILNLPLLRSTALLNTKAVIH